LLERLGPQSVPSTQVEHGARKSLCTDRGSQAIEAATHRQANATGIGWCRRVAGRKPHSRARVERSSGCARASYQVAEVGKRRLGPEKRVSRWQRGAWTGTWPPEGSQESPGANEAARSGITVAKPRVQRSPEPGAREGVAGRGSLPDGRHPGSFTSSYRSRDRARNGLGGLRRSPHHASGRAPAEEATGMSEVRSARVTTGSKTPIAMNQKQGRAAHRSESL